MYSEFTYIFIIQGNMMNYIAIDIGSTYIKSAILCLNKSKVIEKKSYTFPPRINEPKTNHFEVHIDEILKIIKGIIKKYIEKNGKNLKGVLLSTQMHGFIIANKNGEAITNYISWQDERSLDDSGNGVSYFDKQKEILTNEDMSNSGMVLKQNTALANLYNMQHIRPELFVEGNLFCTLGSYIINKLTGNHCCHITTSAATGLYDINQEKWNKDIIKKMKYDCFDFPNILKFNEVCGVYKNLNIYPDIGDQQASVLGCLMKNTDININIATAAQVSFVSNIYNKKKYEVRPFFDGKYLNTISRLTSGRDLDVLVHFVRSFINDFSDREYEVSEVWNIITKKLMNVSNTDLIVRGSFYEIENNISQGEIRNITHDNFTVENVFFAGYKYILEHYAKAIDSLGCKDYNRIIFSGGVAKKNEYLVEKISDYLGVNYTLSPMDDEVMVGLYRIALLCDNRNLTMRDTHSLAMELVIEV